MHSGLQLAQDAFAKAVKLYVEEIPKHHPVQTLLESKYGIQDVQDAVLSAKQAYESHSGISRVQKWLALFSSRVIYYSSVMDMLVQHHPEYVSLAWGTFKFLFVVSPNPCVGCSNAE